MSRCSTAFDRHLLLSALLLAVVSCRGPESADSGRAAGHAPAYSLPTAGTYELDPPHTFVSFAAQHEVVGRVHGRFDQMTGTIVVASDPAACSLDVSIQTSSISTQNTVRDADLRGPDFFDVAKYPTITYRARGIRSTGDGWVADGSLTIRGATKVVPLTFKFSGTAPPQAGKPSRVAFHATAAAKRADFGMTRELIEELGLHPSGVDVWIDIDSEALATETPRH